MNDIIEKANIKDMIYQIRGKQVMLDSDLAKLYGCKNGTKEINQAVSRNIERFPENFYFQLTKLEYNNLKSQFVTSSLNSYGGVRKIPYVFTEQGVAMLSSVLRTKDAARVSINIINAFVEMRHFIKENNDVFKRIIEIENDTTYIKNTLLEYDKNFKIIFDKFDKKEELKNKLFFDGQIYNAYELIVELVKSAKENIIIVDSYIDDSVLKYLKKKNKDVIVLLITSDKCKIDDFDIKKFNSEYSGVTIKYTNKFHDRFIIVDDKILYHLGTSINYIGSKVFGINKIEDTNYLKLLLDMIKCI